MGGIGQDAGTLGEGIGLRRGEGWGAGRCGRGGGCEAGGGSGEGWSKETYGAGFYSLWEGRCL